VPAYDFTHIGVGTSSRIELVHSMVVDINPVQQHSSPSSTGPSPRRAACFENIFGGIAAFIDFR